MKTKSGASKKKLVLNKVSITQLGKDQNNEVKGGGEVKPTWDFPPCRIITDMIYDSFAECETLEC